MKNEKAQSFLDLSKCERAVFREIFTVLSIASDRFKHEFIFVLYFAAPQYFRSMGA